MSDIVKRLREVKSVVIGDHRCWEAAAEIERLRARVAELEKERDGLRNSIHGPDGHYVVRNSIAFRLDKANERVAELEAAQEWRPIETAPEDTKETIILALQNGHTVIGRRWSSKIVRWLSLDGECEWTHATHWMPLPAPPQEIAP